jgi:unsaturated rhamnogalacturonyl hydrolase
MVHAVSLVVWSMLAAAPPLEADVRAVAALAGEPRIVSAAGVTRDETPIVTIENPDAFDALASKRRLVLVGGLDGDEASARLVLDALRWLKTSAPPEIRAAWSVSVLPFGDPDKRGTALTFPPDKGFFDDALRPESRYVWRWMTFQAPDAVIEFFAPAAVPNATLKDALSAERAGGLGSVPYGRASALQPFRVLLQALTGRTPVSPMHAALAARIAREPLAIARTLATRYPEAPGISYIPALAWTQTLRLAAIVDDESLRARVREHTRPWIAGEKKLFGDRVQLTAVAGTMIFAELAGASVSRLRSPEDRASFGEARRSAEEAKAAGERDAAAAGALADEGAALAASEKSPAVPEYGQGWTDDMFMATSVLTLSGGRPGHEKDMDVAARLLTAYAARLQRSDGLFNHAVDGPAAWGRGNGFAALGLLNALARMPTTHPARTQVLDIYRRQMAAVRTQQAPDGAWRQIIDEPGSYREETATAMLLSAMARGIRVGWLDRSYLSTVQRAWRALAAHVADEGTLVDVCAGTGAGPTKRYYLDRPAVTGADDRGGAMALLAAMEVYELRTGR